VLPLHHFPEGRGKQEKTSGQTELAGGNATYPSVVNHHSPLS